MLAVVAVAAVACGGVASEIAAAAASTVICMALAFGRVRR